MANGAQAGGPVGNKKTYRTLYNQVGTAIDPGLFADAKLRGDPKNWGMLAETYDSLNFNQENVDYMKELLSSDADDQYSRVYGDEMPGGYVTSVFNNDKNRQKEVSKNASWTPTSETGWQDAGYDSDKIQRYNQNPGEFAKAMGWNEADPTSALKGSANAKDLRSYVVAGQWGTDVPMGPPTNQPPPPPEQPREPLDKVVNNNPQTPPPVTMNPSPKPPISLPPQQPMPNLPPPGPGPSQNKPQLNNTVRQGINPYLNSFTKVNK